MNKKLTFAYLYDDFPYNTDSFKMIDVFNYAFGIISNGKVSLEKKPKLDEFVKLCHKFNKSIVLVIGGYGHDGFSEIASCKNNRTIFINSIIDVVKTYNLDGIDLDWEYPTISIRNTKASKDDKTNFTLLVKELKYALTKYKDNLILSSTFPGITINIKDCYELENLNQYLDYFHIMSYDMDILDQLSHHTSLYNSKYGINSVDKAINDYINAGVSVEKITLGGTFYGKVFDKEKQITSTPWGLPYDHIKEVYLDKFKENIKFDKEAKSSYYEDNNIFITYDSNESLELKIDYIYEKNLAGIMFWRLNNDKTNTLLKSINKKIIENEEKDENL